jgi:hypothetical protein
MRPFLLNKVFEVNTGLAARRLPVEAVPGVLIDDLLKHPEQAYEIASAAPAANWKHVQGGRNFIDYYDCRLRFPILPPNGMVAAAREAIGAAWGIQTWPQHPSIDVNWFMQIKPRRADNAVPHHDLTEDVKRAFTCIVYLNKAEECSGGTAFFRFRETNSLVPDPAYLRALERGAVNETGEDYWMPTPNPYWEKIGAIDMVPGRMMIFPAEYFHAAWHPRDSFYDYPRLTLVFWMV